MGHYIIALCYEWQLLNRSHNSAISRTEEELYYALKAIERLDIYGESLIPGYNMPTQQYNGYFVRDDVPGDFALNHMGKNYDLVRSDRSCGDGSGSNNEESYDQLLSIHLALAMVEKLIPESVYYNGEKIRDINHGIAINVTNWISGFPGWVLRNPADGNAVPRGWEAGLFFAYPMSVTGREITHDNGRWRDWYSQVVARGIWHQVKLMAHKSVRLGSNAPAPVLQAIMNIYRPGWGATQVAAALTFSTVATDDHKNDNVNMFLQAAIASRCAGLYNPSIWGNWINDRRGEQLINDMGNLYKKKLYNIIGSTLIGGFDYGDAGHKNYWLKEFYKYPCACNCMFNAPEDRRRVDDSGCANERYTTSAAYPTFDNRADVPDDMHPYPWTTPNRWEHWRRNPISEKFKEFDGIDYLEAYAAYMYKFHSNQGIYDRIRVTHTGTLPMPGLPGFSIGSPGRPFIAKAVFDINSTLMLIGSQQATASFYAGSSITLLPGFEASAGSDFEAAIRNYDCIPATGETFMLGRSAEEGLSEVATAESSEEPGYPEEYLMDTTLRIHQDDSSINHPDTIGVEGIDTSIIYIRTSANGDTTFIGLQPCYAIGPDNELVNICDGQQRPYTPNHFSVRALTLAPNPATQETAVLFECSESTSLNIVLTDVLGRDLRSYIEHYPEKVSPGQHRIRINTSSLPAGIYSCIITLGNEKTVRTLTVAR